MNFYPSLEKVFIFEKSRNAILGIPIFILYKDVLIDISFIFTFICAPYSLLDHGHTSLDQS